LEFPVNIYMNNESPDLRTPLERRVLVLPIAWGLYGLVLVFGIQTILGPIANNIPYGPNDKPIGGSVLPLLFFNVAAILGIVLVTRYAVGYYNPDLSTGKARIELGAVGAFLLSGFMVWYSPIFVFSAVAAVVSLMATTID